MIHLGSAAETAVNKHSYCLDPKQAEVTRGWHCYLGGDAGSALQTAVFLALLMKSYPDRFQTPWTESSKMTVRAIGMYYLHVLLVFVPGAQQRARNSEHCALPIALLSFTHSILFLLKSLLKQLEKEERERGESHNNLYHYVNSLGFPFQLCSPWV